MDIFVTSKNKVHDTVKATGAKHVLSLLDVGDSLFITPRLADCNRLLINCEDVLEATDHGAPTKEQIERFLAWAKEIPDDDTVVVHCFAGISRSTAAAITILTDRLGDFKPAIQRIKSVRPNLCPNPVITKFADEIFGFDGEMFKACEEVANFRLLTFLAQENFESS